MHVTSTLPTSPDFTQQKPKSKNKMLKLRSTHSHKSSLKNISNLTTTNKPHSQLTYQEKSPNFLIKQKYFKPAIKQYERADANVITRCICREFDDDSGEGKVMELYEFVLFFTVKEHVGRYHTGIVNTFRERFTLISPVSPTALSTTRHVFHFYDQSFHILRNRMLKLRNLQAHQSVFRSQKGSSIKNSSNKKGVMKSHSKSKNKYKNMDNLLKGIFSSGSGAGKKKGGERCSENKGRLGGVVVATTGNGLTKGQALNHHHSTNPNTAATPSTSTTTTNLKIKKSPPSNLPHPRQTHILSTDTQDLTHLLTQLTHLLHTHCIESYTSTQTSTQQQPPFPCSSSPPPQPDLPPSFSLLSGSGIIPQKSRLRDMKQLARGNQFTEIMESQYSHISAIKSTQIVTSADQYQFYGLSSIREKKMKRGEQNKNSNKNEEDFGQGQNNSGDTASRLTSKRISTTQLQFSNLLSSEQTPKKLPPNNLSKFHPDNPPTHQPHLTQPHNPTPQPRTLRKGLNNSKSKSKSLSSTQRSLKKDHPTGGLLFKSPTLNNTATKLPTTTNNNSAKSTRNISERLLFMEPLSENNQSVRKPRLLVGRLAGEERKESKSKSKGKVLLLKR